jgi:His-Xaa-Ser system protein HxsD
MTDASIDDHIVVDFPAGGFSVEAVKRAAYMLMARLDIMVEMSGDIIRCALQPAKAGTDMSTAERDFRREVLDQDLRMSIELRTEPYRNAILGLAFSKTGLQDG